MKNIYSNIILTSILLILYCNAVYTQSMLTKIEKCPTIKKFVHDSTYIAQCSNVKDPAENKTHFNQDTVMCMSIYAAMKNICLHNSRNAGKLEMEYQVPVNSTMFDLELSRIIKLNSEDEYYEKGLKICKNITILFNLLTATDIYNETVVHYINYAAKNFFASPVQCLQSCEAAKNLMDAKCVILAWAFNLFKSKKSLEPPLQLSKEKNNPQSVLQPVVAINNIPPAKKTIEQKSVLKNNPVEKNEENTRTRPEKIPANNIQPQKPLKVSTQKVDVPVNKNEKTKADEVSIPEKTKSEKPSDNDDKLPEMGAIDPPENQNNGIPGIDSADNDSNPDDEQNEEDGLMVAKDTNLDDKQISKNQGDPPHSLPQDKPWSYEKEKEESHFFTYISVLSFLCVGLYLGFHNKQKILAIALEGRRGSRRGRGSRRRPSTANYRKLDCNLEEAVTSQCSSSATNVIY